MIWIGVIIVTAAAVAAFSRMPFQKCTLDLVRAGRKSLYVISSRRVSDHWKERVLLRYAAQMFKASVALIICALVLVVPVLVGDYIAALWSADLLAAILTWQGLGLSIVTASLQVGVVRWLSKRASKRAASVLMRSRKQRRSRLADGAQSPIRE